MTSRLMFQLFPMVVISSFATARACGQNGPVSPVGLTTAPQTATITIATGGTLNSIAVLLKGTPNLDYEFLIGGTCTAGVSYVAGQTCTVMYKFTPTSPGLRMGGIALTGTSNTVIGEVYLTGTGIGPQLVFSPTTKSVLNTSIFFPHCLAQDGAGNLYTVDQDDSTIKELLRSSNYGTVVDLATGIFGLGKGNSPTCAAMDGFGNLFVTDSNANKVTEVFAQSGYAQAFVLPITFHHPSGVAIDAMGNLFVADESSARIYEITAASGYATAIVFGTGLASPVSMAVDTAENVFVADSARNAIYEITAASGYTVTNKLVSISDPSSLTLDVNGDVYAVSEFGPIIEIYSFSGYAISAQLATADNTAFGLLVDGQGNLYVAEVLQMTEYNFNTPPSFSFTSTTVGSVSSDSPKAVVFTNVGNAPLTFPPATTGANPSISSGFTVGVSSVCSVSSSSDPAATLAAGGSCLAEISFVPIAPGPDSGALIYTDDNLNVLGSSQTIPLNGTAVAVAIPPTVESLTPSTGSDAGGTSTTIAGTEFVSVTNVNFGGLPATSYSVISPTQIVAVSPAGSGIVDVTVSNSAGTSPINGADRFTYTSSTSQAISFPSLPTPAHAGLSVELNATASSGLPVSYVVVSGPGRLNGSLLTYTGSGVVIVQASQAGNSIYSAAPPVTQTASPALLVQPVGSISPVLTTAIGITAAGTLSNVMVSTTGVSNADFVMAPGGSCALLAAYVSGSYCTVNFTYSPQLPGLRMGGIALNALSGGLLSTADIYGEATGPQVNFSPAQGVKLASVSLPAGLVADATGANLYFGAEAQGIFRRNPLGQLTNLNTTVVDGTGLALDGAGDLFVADYMGRTVTEFLAPSLTTAVTIGSGWQTPSAVALDGMGNLFVADRAAQSVFEFTAASNYTQSLSVGATGDFSSPLAVAVDSNANLFVLNYASGNVKRLGPNDQYGSSTVVISGLVTPSAMTIDANGNLDIANTGSGTLLQFTAASGYSAMNNIGSNSSIAGLAADAKGNLYVSDSGLQQITELDSSDPPSLTFVGTPVGVTSSDSPKTVTLINVGTDPLLFAVPSSGVNPSVSTGFSLGASGTCLQIVAGSSAPPTLAPGASCTDLVSFTPNVAGAVSGQLVTTDDHLNLPGARQIVPLNGTAITNAPVISFTIPDQTFGAAPFTVSATSNSAGAITYSVMSGPISLSGTTVTLNGAGTATIQASQVANGSYGAATQSATFVIHPGTPVISFSVGNHTFGDAPFTVAASSSSPAAITYSVVSGLATIAGNVVTLTGAGTVTLQASQAVSTNYTTTSQSATFMVAKAAQTISFPAPATPVPYSAPPVTLAATSSAGLAVSFSVVSGPGSLRGAVLSFTGSGTVVVAADQAGDANYAAAVEVTRSIVVQSPTTDSFTLTFSNPDVTITHGGKAIYSLTLTPSGAPLTASGIHLTLAGAPDGSTVTFAPPIVPSNSGATPITLTIQTPDYPAGPFESAGVVGRGLRLGFAGLGVLFLVGRRKRKVVGLLARRMLGAGALLSLFLMLSGCGWGWGTQRWTIQVTGTSATTAVRASATLTSKPD